MRRASAVDENQPAIVAALRKAGAHVQSLAMVGSGCPDLLVGYCRRTFLLEVKDGSKIPSKRALTELESVWHRSWNGLPVAVVETVEEALKAIGVRASQ